MYVKIHDPKRYGDNKGTCAKLVEYLDKENLDKTFEEREEFFNQKRNDVGMGEVISSIDSNRTGLGKNDSKFYMLSINPSQKELEHIAKKVSGRHITELSQFTPSEKKLYEKELKNYARVVMDEYAKNFNRGLNGDDILYFGKLEHERRYSRDDSNLLSERKEHIKLNKDDVENISFNKYYYADSECSNVCHGLKKGDKTAIQTAAAEMVKNIPDNAVLVPMASSVGYATYTKDMCEEIKKLNSTLDISDVLKCNERQKLYDLKLEGKEVSKEFFNFHLSEEIPKDRPIYLVDNVLSTGSTYINAKEVIPNAKIAVYGINEDTQIKLSKIEQMENLERLGLPKKGELKSGLQSHLHMTIARKDINNEMKLSPLTNHKNSLNTMPNGEQAQIGFDRTVFAQTCETKFDQKLDYKRDFTESFKYHNFLKNKATQLTNDFFIPEEYRKTFEIGKQIYDITKMFNSVQLNQIAAQHLHTNMTVINQLVTVSDALKVESETLKYEIINNTPSQVQVSITDTQRVNDLTVKMQEILASKKTAISGINAKIINANSTKNWDALKEFKALRSNIEKPYNIVIKGQTQEIDTILRNYTPKIEPSNTINNIPIAEKLKIENINAKIVDITANYEKSISEINDKLYKALSNEEFTRFDKLNIEKTTLENSYVNQIDNLKNELNTLLPEKTTLDTEVVTKPLDTEVIVKPFDKEAIVKPFDDKINEYKKEIENIVSKYHKDNIFIKYNHVKHDNVILDKISIIDRKVITELSNKIEKLEKEKFKAVKIGETKHNLVGKTSKTTQTKVDVLNSKINNSLKEKNKVISEYKSKINDAKKNFESPVLKTLKTEKYKLSKPFNDEVNKYKTEINKILAKYNNNGTKLQYGDIQREFELLKKLSVPDRNKIENYEMAMTGVFFQKREALSEISDKIKSASTDLNPVIANLESEKLNTLKAIDEKIEVYKNEVTTLLKPEPEIEIKINTPEHLFQLSSVDEIKIDKLTDKINNITKNTKNEIKEINADIKDAFKAKDWDALKELKSKKVDITANSKLEIDNCKIEINTILKNTPVNNLGNNTDMRHINENFYAAISTHQKDLETFATEIKNIHNNTDFLKDHKDLSKQELFEKLENLKDSHYNGYSIIQKASVMEKDLDTLKKDLYKSLRLVEGKQKVLNPEIYGKSLEIAKKDILHKINTVNRCQTNIKYSKETLYNSTRVITNAKLGKEPMKIAQAVFSKIPIGKEVMAIKELSNLAAANPVGAAIKIGAKVVKATGKAIMEAAGMGI